MSKELDQLIKDAAAADAEVGRASAASGEARSTFQTAIEAADKAHHDLQEQLQSELQALRDAQ